MSDNKSDSRLQSIKNAIRSYPDFPQKGIVFRDLFPVFQNPTVFRDMIDILVEHITDKYSSVDAIVGLDSRGFLIGPIVALQLKKPFIPIRKAGKLPGDVKQKSYTLEYGKATFEIQSESLEIGQKVIIVDDLLATGGSLKTATELVQSVGAKVLECIAIIELKELCGRDAITAPIYSLIEF